MIVFIQTILRCTVQRNSSASETLSGLRPPKLVFLGLKDVGERLQACIEHELRMNENIQTLIPLHEPGEELAKKIQMVGPSLNLQGLYLGH